MIIHGIDTKDISVVVQGAVDKISTPKCLDSIRKFLPGAEIILSTWEGSNVENLIFDQILFNKDPGSNGLIRKYPHHHINNVNRQIVSSCAGIKKSQRKYCFKLRSDMLLVSSDFLKYFNRFSKATTNDSIFEERVMVEGLTTDYNYSFTIGDWWFFGRREDLFSIFDIPLCAETRGTEYFLQKKHYNEKPFLLDIVCQYIPETYIIYQCMKKYYDLYYKNFLDNNQQNLEYYRKFIENNIISIESDFTGVSLPKAANINNPTVNCRSLLMLKWYCVCRKKIKGFPKLDFYSYSKACIKKINNNKLYFKNKKFYNFNDYLCVIKNYCKLKTVKFNNNGYQEINDNEITFVVSGIVTLSGKYNTINCLTNIRKYFPKSYIILSVWKDTDIACLAGLFDELIINDLKDVKGNYLVHLERTGYHKLNSMNGQRLCVNAGLKKVTTKYAVRLRTDFFISSRNFVDFYLEWVRICNLTDPAYRVFDQRILVPRVVMRDTRLIQGHFAYMLSDVFQFGLTRDLLLLWDERQFDRDLLNYFEENPNSKFENPYGFNHRYVIEQMFWLECLKKANIKFSVPKYYWDNSKEDYVFESEKIYAANILVGSQKQLGLNSKFDEENSMFASDEYLTFNRYLEMYLLYIDPGNQECIDYLQREYLHTSENINRIRLSYPVREKIKSIFDVISPAYHVSNALRNSYLENNEKLMHEIELCNQKLTFLLEHIEYKNGSVNENLKETFIDKNGLADEDNIINEKYER